MERERRGGCRNQFGILTASLRYSETEDTRNPKLEKPFIPSSLPPSCWVFGKAGKQGGLTSEELDSKFQLGQFASPPWASVLPFVKQKRKLTFHVFRFRILGFNQAQIENI
jgi:hypothetical protein